MSYNGSGTFNINSAGQPVVTGTVISSTAFNALTADLGTGLSTAITKDGQTVATARIPFAAGINSSLVTDATNTTTGSIITAGGVGIAKALFVGTTLNVAGASTLAAITGTFNGTVGATTPAAGAFTMLTMNGATATGLSAGEIGFTNSAALRWRNGANSGYINCMYLNGTNDLIFGGSAATTILSQITGVGTVTTVSSTGLAVTGTLTSTLDATHYGVTVGRGAGAVSTNTAVGASALAGNTTGSNNVAVGQIALDVNTTGEANTAVGVNSLGANIAGSDNTAVGVSALSFNTSGASNTALGRGALTLNTTASNNTAVGYQAGYSNTTGTENVAVGQGAMYTNTTGNTNTAIGRLALNLNTTGIENLGAGAQALQKNSSGRHNTASGAYALLENTTGYYNTASGVSALQNNTTASNNTAVGYQAGYSQTTADYNTFVGYYAGRSTTGDQNTFLGKFAGNAVTTGTLNTIIGAYNGNQGGLDIRTASNYIVLSDGGGNPLISTNSTRSVALNGAVPQTGTGITFPATQSASTDANTLDDYEEGSWTPTAAFSGGNGTLTYGTQAGLYTKIGRLVALTCRFGIVKGTASGNYVIAGLPFTVGNNQGNYGGAAIGGVIRIGKVGNVVCIRPTINATTADVLLTPFESLNSSTALTAADIDAGATAGNSDLFFSMTYSV